VVAVYLLANGIGCLVPGVYADRFGRRPLILFSLAAYALFSAVAVMVSDFTLLLVMRGLQGVLSAGLMVVPTAIIRDQYEGDQMARLMSVVGAVFITVPVVAPSLGQAILFVADWHMIFLALSGLACMVMVWVALRLPETLD